MIAIGLSPMKLNNTKDKGTGWSACDPARKDCPAHQVRPLLRGCLVGLCPWEDDSLRPCWQRCNAYIQVFCPFCGTFHEHGIDPEITARLASYRVAHCCSGNPFSMIGYWISPWPKSCPEARGHIITPGRKIVRPKPGIELPSLPIGGERAA